MLPKAIIKFIKKHHVMTISVHDAEEIWCSHCFYVYDTELNSFIFASEEDTRHVELMLKNNMISASIVLETKRIIKIKGVQMRGKVFKIKDNEFENLKANYFKRFPYAILMNFSFWIFQPDYVKMTDNTFGFGKKLKWDKRIDN